jgi:glycosyltransferase involved in cell wall biosynthesis
MSTESGPNPLVTVAIPTYNRAAHFLPLALRAACNQTYQNLEILVSDNASKDTTAELVASFGDHRIRYHRHSENLGASGNFNFCIQQARGEYISLLMDDDSIDPDFIQCCMDAARSNLSAGLIRTGTRVIDGQGRLVYESMNLVAGLSFTDFVVAWTEGMTAPFLCSTLFRAAPLRESGMHSRHFLWCDVLTELPIAALHGRIDLPDIKASFCLHAGELTVKAGIEEWCEDSMELVEKVCSLVPEDAPMLRSRLMPFMASHNFRLALRLQKPWSARLRACVTVGRLFGRPQQASALVKELLRHTPWWNLLRNSRFK